MYQRQSGASFRPGDFECRGLTQPLQDQPLARFLLQDLVLALGAIAPR